MSKDNVSFNVKGYVDRRTLDLHQRYDAIEEARWRIRVRANEARRILRGQAGLQPVHVRTVGPSGAGGSPATGVTVADAPFTLVSVR